MTKLLHKSVKASFLKKKFVISAFFVGF